MQFIIFPSHPHQISSFPASAHRQIQQQTQDEILIHSIVLISIKDFIQQTGDEAEKGQIAWPRGYDPQACTPDVFNNNVKPGKVRVRFPIQLTANGFTITFSPIITYMGIAQMIEIKPPFFSCDTSMPSLTKISPRFFD